MTTATKEAKTIVPPFGVEFDHPRNADFVLQAIPGCRIRSAISPTATNVDGSVRTLVDVPSGSVVPAVPGMQIHVNPEKLTFVVTDPLYEDEAACERVRAYMEATTFGKLDKIRGVPPQEEKLDVHRMKNLCRELIQIIEEGHAKVCKGPKPLLEDVDKMIGKYLLNPGGDTSTNQPTFEEDYPEWVERMTKAGM